MKSQIQKPSRGGHARYDEEYKRHAVEHWQKSGRSAAKIEAELGIRASLLHTQLSESGYMQDSRKRSSLTFLSRSYDSRGT